MQYMHFQRSEGQEFQIEGKASAKVLNMFKKQKSKTEQSLVGIWRPTPEKEKEVGNAGMVC